MLPNEAHQLLARMSVVACAQAQRFDKQGGRSVERPSRPAGPDLRGDGDLVAFWRAKMLEAGETLPAVLEEAKKALRDLVRAPDPVEVVPEGREDMEARALVEGEGFPVHLVLVNFPDLTHRQLVALRASNGRSVEDGRVLGVPVDSSEDRLERALRMRADGFSYRQVEKLTGVNKDKILRAERRAA